MKKIKIIFIVIIAITGAILIYNKFDTKEVKVQEVDKHLTSYKLLNQDNVFVFKNIDETLNIINNKTGIIFFCTPSLPWCQQYIKLIDEVAKSNNISKIYYNDIKDDRSLNSLKYRKLVNKLSDYLEIDDTYSKRLNMPYLLFVKNGNVIAYDTKFNLINSEISAEEYFANNDNIMNITNQLNEYIYLLNKEDINE